MIKVNELFAGIGAFRKALQRLNICLALLARDYKGFGNQAMTGVIEYEM